MKKTWILLLITLFTFNISSCQNQTKKARVDKQNVDKTIFVYGDGLDRVFIKYVIGLTHKNKPKICFFPTAAADDERVIGYWYKLCDDLPLRPDVLKTFISSSPEQKTFA